MKTKNEHELEYLLDYELKQSFRHRRFVSLMMLSANGSLNKLNSIIMEAVRTSDPVFFLNDSITVLMGETDETEALKAIERYQEVIGDAVDVRYAVASFPEDGKTHQKLIQTAKHRLGATEELENRPKPKLKIIKSRSQNFSRKEGIL